MKTQILAVSISLLLCACAPDAPSAAAPASDAAAPVAPTAAADTTPSAAATSTPDAPVPADAVPAAAGVNATPDGDKAVSDAIDTNLGDHTRYQTVITDLQAAVAAGDAAKVAALAQYPIGVDIGGKKTVLKNEKEFVARYSEFMTPDISKAIVETKYADLFVNYKGVMFGRGEAWINGICKDNACKAFDVKLVTLQHGPD